jgi:hypothetical protein
VRLILNNDLVKPWKLFFLFLRFDAQERKWLVPGLKTNGKSPAFAETTIGKADIVGLDKQCGWSLVRIKWSCHTFLSH